MRNTQTITLTNKLKCTASELTVEAVLSLLWLMDDLEYPTQLNEFVEQHHETLINRVDEFITLNTGDKFLKMAAEQQEVILSHFFAVNAVIFKKSSPEAFGFSVLETITGKDFYYQLSRNVEALTRTGHANILQYPFSFYLTVLNHYNEAHSG